MNAPNKGGRPKADPRAVEAWTRYRPSAMVKFAKAVGVSQPAASAWVQVPEKRLTAAARYLRVEPRELRPDLFPPWAGL